MIECPRLKVNQSSDYIRGPFGETEKGIPGSQGFVSFGACLRCESNRGDNIEKATIQCGLNPKEIKTIKSVSL